jgi:hypothetical protein
MEIFNRNNSYNTGSLEILKSYMLKRNFSGFKENTTTRGGRIKKFIVINLI